MVTILNSTLAGETTTTTNESTCKIPLREMPMTADGFKEATDSPAKRRSRRLQAKATHSAVANPSVQDLSPRITGLKRRICEQQETGAASRIKRKRTPMPVEQQAEAEATSSIDHWLKHGNWPSELFHPHPMAHLLAKKKSSASLTLKRSSDGSNILSRSNERRTGEEKSAPYKNPLYEEVLKTKNFVLGDDHQGPSDDSVAAMEALFSATELPKHTLFDAAIFARVCQNLHNKNEARVVRDFGDLIVPSAENLFVRQAISTENLVESVNESWSCAEPITPVRPQPDFAAGFGTDAFSSEQHEKLLPILGNGFNEVSRFRATPYMCFPFLSRESTCAAAAIDIADRQNGHSMGIAVRAIADLFQLAGREQEIDREMLAFSISHDNKQVRIYGHYPVFKGQSVTFYRHTIREFLFQPPNEQHRWVSYTFVKNLYEIWASKHLQRLIQIIDELPTDITHIGNRSSTTSNSQRATSSIIAGENDELLE